MEIGLESRALLQHVSLLLELPNKIPRNVLKISINPNQGKDKPQNVSNQHDMFSAIHYLFISAAFEL